MAANVVLNSYFQRLWDVPFLCVLLILPVIQKYFRFKRARQISARYDEDKGDGSMAKMTNDEAWSIIMSIAELEFPFFYRKALQFALFRVCFPRPIRFAMLIIASDLRHHEYFYSSSKDCPAVDSRTCGQTLRGHWCLDHRVLCQSALPSPNIGKLCPFELYPWLLPQVGSNFG